uniref:HECT and RLD domain containing E3 ubiquitin protein ligase 4 n=1 Tax=Sus scrofa TaxID=9823 RepID=A0A287AP80_PIG
MLCWGNASFGQLGLGGIDEEIVLEPRKSDFFINKKVRDVGCGLRHTVFVLDDGTVYTCGCNDLGQLGHEKSRKKPEQVVALDAQNIVAVSCGEAHTLALNDKGQVYAWGLDSDGQLGLLGTEECIRVPRNIKSLSDIQIVQVACGYYHSLALSKASEVFCWGQNKYGQLGLGIDCKKQSSPQLIKSLLGIPFMQVAAGGAHSFVLTLSGAIFGWGRNKFGQLGLNDENDRYVPNLLKSLRTQKIVYICCGEDHTAALTKEGGVFTFGAGGYGQLGHNSTSHEINPRKVFELMGSIVTQIACGRQHTSAFVPSSGRIYSFGLGGNGQLGTGSTSNRKSPFTVKGNWFPYNGQCPPDFDSEEYFCVKRIFSGGDQSFSHYSNPQNCGPPDDFRFSDPSKQIWTVNEALIQKWLSYPSGRFPVEIANEIDGTFSSSGCLNGSFLAVSNDDHYRTGTRFSGVDMNAARLLFHKLIQPDHPQISQQVAASLEKNLIPKLTSSLPDVEALRFYLTLPECPLMSDSNNFTTIAIPFGTALVNLEKAPLKVLENWWSVLEPPLFLKIVELFKEVVVHLLKLYKIGIPPSERRIFNSFLHTALKVLEILHRVNEKTGQIIQYDKFYIHEVQELIDIRNDYINWVQQQAYGMLADIPVTICTYPFVFDAQAKTTLLQTDAVLQMQMAIDQAHRQNVSSLFLPVIESVNPCLILVVRRENIVGDAMEVLRKTKNIDYKKPLKVIFVGEDAVDAGGVRKEFFLLIMRELLDPKYGMFRYYEDSRLIWFSDKTFEDSDLFHLIGVICGLAIYNFTIVDLHFPLALYKKLLKKKPSLDDLKELVPDVGRQEFVDAYVDYIFNKSVASLFDAFHAGFHKVCGGKVLQLFQPNELQAMVIGNTNYDWKELEKNTEYKGEYWAEHPTIKMFWEVFHELPLEKKKQFLLFLTGSDRIPILGMKSLILVIQSTGGGEEYLPVSHTCFNLLDLPKYTDKETLRSKLIQAIDHNEGFSLI